MRLLDSTQYINDLRKAAKNINLDVIENKTFFITGGLGLIASTIADVLVANSRTIVYIGARSEQRFQERFGGCENVKFIKYDALGNLDLSIRPDYIIHGAGLASPELYTEMPVETVLSNLNGVHALLEFVRQKGTGRLLYISSSEVYGKKANENSFVEGEYGEIDIDNIRSSYSIAKRASEILCRAYTSEYNVDTIIVRPGHVYGPSASKADKRLSSDFAYKAAAGENLEMKSSGLQKRSYCYSVDCAIQILTVLISGKSGEAYNIGNDSVTTIKKMAELYAKAGNVKLTTTEATETELKAFNPMNNSSLDNRKIRALGYKDTFSVEEGVKHTVEILKEIM